MHELKREHFSRVEPLFHDLIALHGSVSATLSGAAEGHILVDDLSAPSVALLDGPEGFYLGGGPIAGRDYFALRQIIPPWAYLYPSKEWLAAREWAMPHPHMQRHDRVYLATRPSDKPMPALSAPFELVLEQDGPLSSAVLCDGETVAHCRPDMIVDDRMEIGVWTRPDMRRRGLASAVVRASRGLAAAAGIRSVGWHCHASNAGSIAVARRAGFEPAATYVAWSASLPAENAGDLQPDRCRSLAQAFEAGRQDFDWLDFHAAVAWSEAGETERALVALERLVEGPWMGRSDWLEGHWALQRLRHEPRFQRALEIQAGK
ncbi:GNAT family N-acetyltransferase [Devosia sediminis]|uniref:GNAT family N-acetyltransferase n=1 Tax=Devosia sediminis TaxID=2798801 RepID=A0A934IX91_9HYPH|nr:GNAT family N-acetyltransferase [Devosia sediminis]MBJ3783972.1 GNAT family N-acetyltransferase [Devosia sediminis]